MESDSTQEHRQLSSSIRTPRPPFDQQKSTMSQMNSLPLSARVHTALERNPYLSRRNLQFEAEQGRVTLRGVVRTFFQKQMAQEALRGVDGIDEIHNELEVAML